MNSVYALGMGKIKVYSYLDEPLVAEIELIGTDGLDPYQLIVKLASAQDFARAGMERPFFLNNIDFDVIFYDSKGYIFMRSVKPVQIPYLEFLVELSWPEGSLIKDYTILIDPPPANLSKDTRPLAYGQLAQIEAQQRSFGTDVIAEQLSEQELIGSGARVLTPKKTEQKSFSDQDVQVVTSETGEVTVSDATELVPEVVPDITDEDLEIKADSSPSKQGQSPAAIPDKKPVVTTQQETTIQTETGNTKFAEQLAEYDRKQLEQYSQPKRQSWVGSLAPAEKVLPEESPKKPQKPKAVVVEEQPATPEQIQQEIAAEQSSVPVEEEIDFATVIEPVPPEQVEPVTPKPENAPGKLVASTPPPADEGGSIILPLIFTVFAVVVLAVGGLAAKKYILDKKSSASKDKKDDSESIREQQKEYDWDDEAELDDEFEVVETVVAKPVESKDEQTEIAAMAAKEPSPEKNAIPPVKPVTQNDTPEEEIELAPPPPPPKQDSPEDLAAVEAELANLDLNILSPDPDSGAEDVATEVNIDTDVKIPVAGKEAPDLFPEPDIEIDSSLKLAPEADESSGPEVEKAASIESLSTTQLPGLRDADIDIKLDLARKYIDAGDKESAKSLLLEVQEIAKDEQKVEIEMLLSTLP